MKHSENNAHRERTPWLIVTSLEGGASITKRVINLYKTRMQIEEGFRDFKNSRWGFSLDEAKVSTSYRYENLLLVGALATFAVWLTGKVASFEKTGSEISTRRFSTCIERIKAAVHGAMLCLILWGSLSLLSVNVAG